MKRTRKRVLVADCHEDILIILERLLEDAGFDTTTVWTAKEALKLADSHAFDLILINEYLPDAECEDVLRALQKRGQQTPASSCNRARPRLSTSPASKLWARKTSSANTVFGRLSRLLGNVCCVIGSRSRLPKCEPGGTAESL